MEVPDATHKRSGSAADTESLDDPTASSTAPVSSAASEAGPPDGEDVLDDEDDQLASASVASSNVRNTQTASAAAVAEAAHPAPARTPSTTGAAAGAPTERSLNGASDNLVLFDLTSKRGENLIFSPHTIKTVLDLKLLGVGYDRQRMTFVQIRGELADRIAENVTVPALELADGTHIMDSWTIAEYLERNHPRGHLLFGSSAAKRLAALLNAFGKTVLAPSLGPLVMPGIHRQLDEESADYFANVKIGPERWAKISTLSQSERDAHVSSLVAKLTIVETMLNAEGIVAPSSGATNGGAEAEGNGGAAGLVGDFAGLNVRAKRSRWVAGGEQPSHADFVLFGWYVFSRAAGPTVVREVWSAHKGIRLWINDMLEWCGEIANDFVPI